MIGKFTAASGNREWGLWTSGTTNGVEFFRYTAGGFTGAGILANAAFYDGTPTLLAGRTDATGKIETLAWKSSLGLLKSAGATGTWRTAGPGNLAIGAYQDDATGNEFAFSGWDFRIAHRPWTDSEIEVYAHTLWDLYDTPDLPMVFDAAVAASVPFYSGLSLLGVGSG